MKADVCEILQKKLALNVQRRKVLLNGGSWAGSQMLLVYISWAAFFPSQAQLTHSQGKCSYTVLLWRPPDCCKVHWFRGNLHNPLDELRMCALCINEVQGWGTSVPPDLVGAPGPTSLSQREWVRNDERSPTSYGEPPYPYPWCRDGIC